MKYGHVVYWGPQDPGQAGKAGSVEFVSLLAGFVAHTQLESGPKEVRAQGLAAQAEVGNVFVLRGPWSMKFIQELTEFPSGAFDDQVDAASGAFSKLPPRNARSWLDYQQKLMRGEEAIEGNGKNEARSIDGESPSEVQKPNGLKIGSVQELAAEQERLGRAAPRRPGQWAKSTRIGR